MPRYIDVEPLYDRAFGAPKYYDEEAFIAGVSEVFDAIEEQPTIDAVPVVRCENCQYWQPPTYQEQEDGSTVGHCTAALNGQQTDAYWFCADGAR